ncbi:MAG: response regulator [Burkholderiaceae bacterium]|nr:response regulator [Burkholderiaceae bacterium]
MESRPEYRVAAAGLDPRDVRLIEIVFKHSQYNRYGFRFETGPDPLGADILIVNPLAPEGLRAVARVRSAGRSLPVISAVPRGATSSARHAISIERLTLQLLPILNRVVELELRRSKDPVDARGAGEPRAATPGAAGPTAGAAGASANANAGGGGLPPPSAAGSGAAAAGAEGAASTREFLREAARKSREGDQAREAAARARAAAVPQPAEPTPARTGQAPSNLVAFPRSAEPAPPRIRVLVVDDSPTVRQQLSIAFSRMSVSCDAAASADEALARLAETHYDLVLVDVVMPGVDGYKLTRQIRRRHRGVPVIILTSRSSPFDLARGALAGCNSYLVKPVPLRQLEAAVVKQLRKSLAIDDLNGLLRLTPDAQALAAAQGAKPAPDGAGTQSASARTRHGGGAAG